MNNQPFKKSFEVADAATIAKLTPEERAAYQESLKHYRDIKNIVDTSKAEGMEKGIMKVAKIMKENGEPEDKIIAYTGLSKEELDAL